MTATLSQDIEPGTSPELETALIYVELAREVDDNRERVPTLARLFDRLERQVLAGNLPPAWSPPRGRGRHRAGS